MTSFSLEIPRLCRCMSILHAISPFVNPNDAANAKETGPLRNDQIVILSRKAAKNPIIYR